ncbi:hypothetical protein FQU23_005230 [Flavobacterium sp. XN-5]|uniref:DUF6252 family protein n=1 Tax=Flavobacterium sp. XN-5 TaxID=2599390 RepID=UPI0011C955F8|nr:DUF6252 family protein [Flavobacterium sp. XN-5]NGY36913.1 hypothetical protein [Flavobacterium sp. XN-5]
MKNFVLYIVVLFSIVSCEEDVRFNNPSIQGMKNNVFWRALDFKATLGPNGSVVIEAYTGYDILTLKTTSTKEQNYPLGTSNSKTAVFVMTQDADKITYSTGINIGDGEIIISKYDDVNNTISGTFKFNAKNTDSNSAADPVLNFQNGVFYKVPVELTVP